MAEDPTKTFTGHNFKSDYKYKITQRQKANGEIQLEETSVRSDDIETILNIAFDLVTNWYKVGKGKNIRVVSPYEKDHEPTV